MGNTLRGTALASGLIVAAVATAPVSPALADTRTFGNPTPMIQPNIGFDEPFTPYATDILVSGIAGAVTDMTVTLHGFTSGFPIDVIARLEGPSGAGLNLLGSVGGFPGVTGLTLAFNDAGPAVPEGDPVLNDTIVSGTYRPTTFNDPTLLRPMPAPAPAATRTTLSEFLAEDVNGTWSLYMFDQYTINVHELAGGWSILFVVGPSAEDELADLAAAASTTSRLVVLNARELSRYRAQSSFAARAGRLSFTRSADPQTGEVTVTQSTRSHDAMMGDLYTWIDVTGFQAEDDDRSYSGRGLQIGADLALGPDAVAGLSFGFSELDGERDGAFGTIRQDGVMRFVQPYIALRNGPWSGEASFIHGRGSFDQSSSAGSGEGDTRLSALTLTGSYDLAVGGGFGLSPTVAFAHGVEDVEGASGTLSGAGDETVRFSQASLGAEISRSVAGGRVFGALHADWLESTSDTPDVSDLLVDDGWSGRLALGVATALGAGLSLDASVEVSGLGDDLRTTRGAVRFAYQF